ncbi:MAG: NAD(P)/FAD-dependent oxidoreductase [Thermoanaerobaculia bacterium]
MARRPFRALRDRPPHPSYDVVVVGAGVGGLVAAALLSRAGFSVLLVEQHYMVGGYCSTFRRRGFTFDAATHFYPLLGNPQALTARLMAELGVETRWVAMDPVDTFHLPDGSRFVVPADFELYLERLFERFPAEREALNAFFAEVREAYLLGTLEYFRLRPTSRLDRFRSLTLREVLDRFFRDPALKLILTADGPHWGSPPSRTSFVFDSMLRLSYFLGNYYPRGGSQAFADDLARCVEQAGGEILMSSRVERILVQGGRTTGVELETTRGPLAGRHSVAARAVISNADLSLTLERLLPREVVPDSALEPLRRLRTSFPCYLTHVGLRNVDGAVLERAQGYYWQSWDPDTVGRGGLRFKIFAPTLYEPAMAPPGKQIVILQKVLDLDYEGVSDWPSHKTEVERYLLGELEREVPGIHSEIEVATTASALTSHRFTLNRRGVMLGWEMSPDQLGDARPGIEGPVPGLWLTGHWVRPGGGITPVIVSAQQAAEAVAAELGAGSGAATREL